MPDLRTRAIVDAKRLNLRDWSGVIELIDPDGNKYDIDNETGQTLKAVQILSDYRRIDPMTGETIVITEPIVVMARSSLSRIPQAGEIWSIKIQLDPQSETLENYLLTGDRSPEGGRSLGLIRLYPIKAEQSA